MEATPDGVDPSRITGWGRLTLRAFGSESAG